MFATWENNHRQIKFCLYIQGAYIKEQQNISKETHT